MPNYPVEFSPVAQPIGIYCETVHSVPLTLPGVLLAIQVNLEVCRVEVNDRRILEANIIRIIKLMCLLKQTK